MNNNTPLFEQIKKEVVALLTSFGYKPIVKEYENFDDIQVLVHGSDAFYQRYKDAISMLVKGYLQEFYYENDTQHIRLYKECKGLFPNDDRYSCLIYQMNKVPYNEYPCNQKGEEVFVNLVDSFTRLVNK